MENNSAGKKVKDEKKDKILFKNYVYTAMHAVNFDTQVYYDRGRE